jgi:hypothetical protein
VALSPLTSVSRHVSARVLGRKSWTTNACTGWSAPCRVGNENERVSTECGVGSWSLRMRGLSDFGVDDVVDLPGAGAPVRRLRRVVTSVVTSATHINVTTPAATATTSQTVHESMEERDDEPSGPAAVLSLGSPPVLDEPPWPRFLAPIVLDAFFSQDCTCVTVCVCVCVCGCTPHSRVRCFSPKSWPRSTLSQNEHEIELPRWSEPADAWRT